MSVPFSSGFGKQFFLGLTFVIGAAFGCASAPAQTDQSAPPPKQQTTTHPKPAHPTTAHHTATPSNAHASHSAAARINHTTLTRTAAHHRRRRPLTAHELARSRRLQRAF